MNCCCSNPICRRDGCQAGKVSSQLPDYVIGASGLCYEQMKQRLEALERVAEAARFSNQCSMLKCDTCKQRVTEALEALGSQSASEPFRAL